MSDLPLVSIVTPSYNQARFLETTIRSVLDQDYPHIEYIVVDGGSTDGSVEIIRKYESRIAYWVSEPDGGQAEAINKGWSRSHGSVLAYLNSDDYYAPGAVSLAVAALRGSPQAGLVHGTAQIVSTRGQLFDTLAIRLDAQGFLDRFESLPQPAVFVRRGVINKVGLLDQSLHLALDTDFFMRVIGNYDVVTVGRILAYMRFHASSKSVAMGPAFGAEFLRVAQSVVAHPEAYPRFRVDRHRVLAAAHLKGARFCYVHGAYGAALRHLWMAWRISRASWRTIAAFDGPRLLRRILIGPPAYMRAAA